MWRRSTFTPPRHAATAPRCGLFLLRRSQTSEAPSWFRQAGPYALIGATVLATVLLWSFPKIPNVDPEVRVPPEESYKLPGSMDTRQLKSVLVERDAEGKVVGEMRTYDADEKPPQAVNPAPSIPPRKKRRIQPSGGRATDIIARGQF